MNRKEFHIYHPSQLNILSTLPWVRKNGLGKIVLDESFQHHEKEQLERQINKYYYTCGCSQSAKALLIGLFLFSIIGVLGYVYFGWMLSMTVTILFGGALLLSIIVKILVLISANEKLKKLSHEVRDKWHPKWPDAKTIGCG